MIALTGVLLFYSTATIERFLALLHSINERVAKVYEEGDRPMPRVLRPALAVAIMVIPVYAALLTVSP